MIPAEDPAIGDVPGLRSGLRVLVVDDDVPVRRVIRRALEHLGMIIEEAADGPAALELHAAARFDIIVLDHHLPDVTGLDVLTELRMRDQVVGVIMLTAAVGEADRVRGLARGADDYVPKPFSVRELAARIDVLARRRNPGLPAIIEVGEIRIDSAAATASVHGRSVRLRRREFELLRHLAAHAGHTFSRDELLHAVWQSSAEWQSPATVTEHIRRLRQQIEPVAGRPLITTVRGVGYRFEPVNDVAHDIGPDSPDTSELGRTAHDIANRLTVIATTAELATAEIETAAIDELLRQSLTADLRSIQEATAAAARMATQLTGNAGGEADGVVADRSPVAAETTVLLVDDDDDLRATIERTLRNHGYRVVAAGTGHEAVELHAAHRGDIGLVLTDVSMPDMGLGEAAMRIRSAQPEIPMLHMSGFSHEVLAAADMVPAEAALLRKPFTSSVLISSVSKALDRP